MARPRVTLSSSKVYNSEAFLRRPEYIRNSMSYEEMRSEYRALRDVAMKRISNLEKSPDTYRYKGLEGYIDRANYPVSKGMNVETLSVKLSKLGDFLNIDASTIRGQIRSDERKMKELENSLGIKFNSRQAFHDFTDAMELLRSIGLDAIYDSDQIISNFTEEYQNAYQRELDKFRIETQGISKTAYRKARREFDKRVSKEQEEYFANMRANADIIVSRYKNMVATERDEGKVVRKLGKEFLKVSSKAVRSIVMRGL